MPRYFLYRMGMAGLIFATMFASTGSASRARVETSLVPPIEWPDFSWMDAKGDVSVDDAVNPTRLTFDLKSSFRLNLKSDGINPLTEKLVLQLQYGSAVGPMYIVAVPAGSFMQAGKSFFLRTQDSQYLMDRGVSITFADTQQAPDEILPYMENFDLRLAPGPKGQWDLKLSIDFLASSKGVPFAGVIAILRSPSMVKLAIGNDEGGDDGAVTIGKIDFGG